MKNTIPALTGIRYVAALMVLIHHLAPVSGNILIDNLVKELNVGVTIFFVLSGFLISYRYYEDYTDGPVWKRSYLINRVARIYPMYAIVTCITFLFLFRTSREHIELIKTLFLNLTLLRGFSDKYVYTGISQGWTLSVEEAFYLFAPLIFFMSKKVPLLIQTLVFLIAGFLILYCTGLMSIRYILICTFFGRSFEFMCGTYLFFIIKNNKFKPKIRITMISGVGIAGLIFVMSKLSYPPYSYGVQNPIGLFLNNCIMPIAIASFFWALINERSLLQRLLSTKVFEVLGKSSYTLYLIHYGIYNYLITKYVSANVFVVFLVIQVSAILAWKFIEEPLNKLIRSRFEATKVPREALLVKY